MGFAARRWAAGRQPDTMKDRILRHLSCLIGKKLSIARRAADMRMFHFGQVATGLSGGTSGEFALHIQCAWRIEGPSGIVTGRSDLWQTAEPNDAIDWDTWDYDKEPNLQDRRIGELLGTYAPGNRSYFIGGCSGRPSPATSSSRAAG